MMTNALLLALAAVTGTAGNAPAPDNGRAKANANAEFLAKNYPVESLRRGEQGRVEFELSFDSDGSLMGCKISRSSGFQALDEGTCDILVKSAKIEPARDAQGRQVRTTRTGYIDWKLPSDGVRMAQASAAGGKSSTDPLICKRTSVPGSIIKKIKRCMTKNEWAIQDRLVREEVRRAMDGNTCSDHGC